jgi:hypothetical protein
VGRSKGVWVARRSSRFFLPLLLLLLLPAASSSSSSSRFFFFFFFASAPRAIHYSLELKNGLYSFCLSVYSLLIFSFSRVEKGKEKQIKEAATRFRAGSFFL